MKQTILAAAFFGISAFPAHAMTTIEALDHLSDDFVACSVYYTFVTQVPKLPQTVKEQYTQAAKAALWAAETLSNQNVAVTGERFKAHAKEMADLIKTSGDDQVLINLYSNSCKSLMENPTEGVARTNKWLETKQ
jgi:hypothetical protein